MSRNKAVIWPIDFKRCKIELGESTMVFYREEKTGLDFSVAPRRHDVTLSETLYS